MTDDRRTVLIVDDEPEMRSLVRLILEIDGGYDIVAEAQDGPDALVRYAGTRQPPVPHVVLLDNLMPNMTGIQVAAELRQKDPDQHIVLFTASITDQVRRDAHAAGINRVVSKDAVTELPDILRSIG